MLLSYNKTAPDLKVVLFLSLSLFTTYLYPQDYNYSILNTDDGLAQSFVYSITQDEKGYLWIGTGNGLSKYNGFNFENYSVKDSLADNFISCGISDGEYLWFGHMNGKITCFNGQRFSIVRTPDTNSSPVTNFRKHTDNRVWASTYSDGFLSLGQNNEVVIHKWYMEKVNAISFSFINDSDLLVGTNTGLLYCRIIESGDIEIVRSIEEIPDSKITCIKKIREKSGYFIATENDGIFMLTIAGKLFNISEIKAQSYPGFTGIQDLIEDEQQNLWLASFGNGIIKVIYSSEGKFTDTETLNKANGFTTNNIKTLFEDREGNIWSGNYGEGITQITPKTFSVFTLGNPRFGNEVHSLWINNQYRWIGTENGLAKMDVLTEKILRFYSQESGLPKEKVTTIFSSDGAVLWIGTEKNGLFRMEIENDIIRKYPISDGNLENSITSITGRGDEVWIGTKKGLCNINIISNKTTWYSIIQGLPHNSINCLYIDKTGRLWVTTPSNALAYIENEKVSKIIFGGRLTLGPITEDADSRIWIGSIGNGVFTIKSDSVINLTEKEGLLSDYCYSIICDDNRNIWTGHIGGLSRINSDDYSIKAIPRISSESDSYKFNNNAITKDQKQIIWFGSTNGIVKYDPSLEYHRSVAPALEITAVIINDEEREYSDKIILSPGKYKIRIEYMGISLKDPDLVTYQHKLEGYDQWSDITKNKSVTYYNVTEGDYTFILKAANGDGVVSKDPLSINIIIKIPIWKSWWFYLITIISIVILIILYMKSRDYKYEAEKRILEEKVRERTSEIQFQKNEIEMQRDLIDEKNASITSSIEYASHIQQAILPPAELLNRLFPDNFVLNIPKDIVSGDFYWMTQKKNKIIIAVADCTGHGVPGAFMSLLGITLLNEIVNIQGIERSDAIVTKLRERVISSLQQGRKESYSIDGMDLALCVIDKNRRKIQYTGGMNDLIYFRKGNLERYKADRFSVCYTPDYLFPFTVKEFEYEKGDEIYMFSDGYQDQFGGKYDKKFLITNFHLTLRKIHALPMLKQKELLAGVLRDWMKDRDQTDDILVIGIRF